MSSMGTILLAIVSLACWTPHSADDPATEPGPVTRVVEGRILASHGQPVREGKVFFGPRDPRFEFIEEATASLDAEGRYHIELKDFPLGPESLPATGELRFLALATGFRPELGKLEPGNGPSVVDIRLTPESWKETVFRFVDRRGAALAGVHVDVNIAGAQVWETIEADVEGRCRVATPAGLSFWITARPERHLTTSLGFRGVADDPSELTVPLYDLIRGRVIDPAGKPLPGIQIGRLIAPNYNAGVPDNQLPLLMYGMKGSREPATTDAEGRFDLRPSVNLDSRSIDPSGAFQTCPEPLCFADRTLRHVAFLSVDLKDIQPFYEVVLKPARNVRIPLEHEVVTPSGRIESAWEIYSLTGEGGPRESIRVMSGVVGPATEAGHWLEAYWPEGKYRLSVRSGDPVAEKGVEETTTEIVVPPGDGPLTLPTLHVTALPNRRLIGQPAPEIDARELKTGKPVRLDDFRGMVVVLDFWGYWCGPCIGSMPELMRVHDQFKDRPVVILAIHDQSVQSREEYERKLSGVRRNVWEGRDLPFLVALDRPDPELAEGESALGDGVTCNRYMINAFPTTVVIDAEGKVVGNVNAQEPGRLEAMLEEQLEKARSR